MATAKKPRTKASIVKRMLSRERGASIDELKKATAWQGHSVRAALSGFRKSLTIEKVERLDGVTSYRLLSEAPGEVCPDTHEPTVQ